ncbi:MAG: hypothetical protein AMXMBFR64_39670 [Myxococcales bacterium]
MSITLSRLAMSFIGVTCLLCAAATGCKNQESSGEGLVVAAQGPENSAKPGKIAEAEVLSAPPTKEAASAPAVAPPPSPPKGRPSYMPCIVTVGSRENISEVYNLGYDDAGRLVRTTRQLTAGQCPTLNKKCRDFLDSFASKDMATDYTYDDTGRLSKVIRSFGQGRRGVLSLTYSPDGHMASYEYRETLENGSENHHAGTINYGADSRVAGVSERGQVFAGGMQDTIRTFSAVAGPTDSPYAGAVVVWPFQIETPYLGWTAANGSYQLGRIKIDVTENYEFGPDARITAMTQSDNDGGSFRYGFAYDGCPSAALVDAETPDQTDPRKVGLNDLLSAKGALPNIVSSDTTGVSNKLAAAMSGTGSEFVMGHGSGGMGFKGMGGGDGDEGFGRIHGLGRDDTSGGLGRQPGHDEFTPDQVRAASVATFLINLQRYASNCEEMKMATAASVAHDMKTSRSEASRYWAMWKFNQDTSGLPEIPRTIIQYKKKFADSALADLRPVAQDSGIAEACRDALLEALKRAATACADTGEPRSTDWILKVGNKCYVKGVPVH